MEYLYYILAILVIGLVCTTSIRLFTRHSRPQPSINPKGKRRAMPAARFAAWAGRKSSRQHDTEHVKRSLRALLEDRYRPVNRDNVTEFEFKPVKRPLLRDPRAPHDQMDNFGTRQAEQVRAALERRAKLKNAPRNYLHGKDFRYVETRDVKLPWGW